MLFNTWTFALFLPVVLSLFLALRLRGRQVMLLAASYLFYCWSGPVYGLLLLASTVLDYYCGLGMAHAEGGRRRLLLACSLAGNLGMLGFFKYGDFAMQNALGIAHVFGADPHWTPMRIILPVGISFYTFQTLSYSIDVYRRRMVPERDLINFALFVSFFPQLVAGPIERADRLLPQLQRLDAPTWDDVAEGLRRMAFGLFKKVVIADRLAILVDRTFAHLDLCDRPTLWVAMFAFGIQIFMDFAGYADIAIGSARLFGVRLTDNFRHPLVACNIADFWNRWHISLTSWLRDYLFNPLGGARRGGVRMAINGTIVMLACGLWHGASWHFVAWGAFHAVHMIAYYAWRYASRRGGRRPAVAHGLAITALQALTLFVVNSFSGILFRAGTLEQAGTYLSRLFLPSVPGSFSYRWDLVTFAAIVAACWLGEFALCHLRLRERVGVLAWPLRATGLAVTALLAWVLATNNHTPYIYFQF